MIPSDLTMDDWDRINGYMKRGATIAEIARKYGIKEDSLRGAVRKRAEENPNPQIYSLLKEGYSNQTLDDDAYGGEEVDEYVPPTEEEILRGELVDLRVRTDRRFEVLKAENNHLKRLYNVAIKKGATEETLVEVLRDTVISMPT